MVSTKIEVKYPDLKNSELHHDLKNQPGENGDPDHAEDGDGKLPSDIEQAVKDGEGDNAIAAELKDAVDNDKT